MTTVTLQRVEQSLSPVLANLLELYCHDLSPHFGLRIGADGRFGYPPLSSYWSEPTRRHPFFILADAELVGFALATRGSPATHDELDFDVAEFFVLRAHRRSAVGKRAAHQLWELLPGHWVVRAAPSNTGAVSFWRGAIAEYAQGDYVERSQELNGALRTVFELDSHASR